MRIRVFILSSLIAALAISCGPSLRRTQQSDNAFARCFDIDYNPGAKKRHKVKCWKTWLGEYVYNQPADKTGYAKLRLDELDKGVSVPGPPGKPGSFTNRSTPKKSPNKPKTPPKKASSLNPKIEDCEERCKNNHTDCIHRCGEEGRPETRCSNACIELYTNCINKCLR